MNATREKEKNILRACLREGDMEGLVREYGGLISATVRKTLKLAGMLTSEQDVEDGAIEVYIRLFSDDCRKLRQFDPEKLSLGGWIKLIANQTAIDELRKKDPHSVSRQNERVMIEEVYHLLRHNTEDAFEVKERLRIVIESIEQMLPNDRWVLKMFYLEHLTLEEVAVKLGKSKKTTQTVKDRARNRLLKKLEEGFQF